MRMPVGRHGGDHAHGPSTPGAAPKAPATFSPKGRSSTQTPLTPRNKPRRMWGSGSSVGPVAVGSTMEVPEVPSISPPPPPRAVDHGARRRDDEKETPDASGVAEGCLAKDLQRAIEALGKVLCCKLDDMEGALERALERVLEAALARALAAVDLEPLLRQALHSQPCAAGASLAAGTLAEKGAYSSEPDESLAAGTLAEKGAVEPEASVFLPGICDCKSTADDASAPAKANSKSGPVTTLDAAAACPQYGALDRLPPSCVPLGASASSTGRSSHSRRPETLLPGLFTGDTPSARPSKHGTRDLPSARGSSDGTVASGMWPIWCTEHHIEDCGGSHQSWETVRTRVDVLVRLRQLERGETDRLSGGKMDLELPDGLAVGQNMSMLPASIPVGHNQSMVKDMSRLQMFVMHPASNPILIWHIIALFLLGYDLVMIPMHTFPQSHNLVMQILGIISTTYWSLDTVRGFFTGYEMEDSVEMRPGLIAKRYIKSWFFLDFVTCALDWAFVLGGSDGLFNKFWRTNRAVKSWRILRLARLVRVVKFANRITQFVDRVLSMQAMLALKSLYILGGICFFCHYLACYWFAVGDIGLPLHIWETGENWLQEHKLENASFADLYAISFHWALAQSGFCPTNVFPTNMAERIFASCTSFLWLIIVSVTINLISMWLSQLRESNKDRETQWLNLKKYLDEHEISSKLTYRVLRYFRMNYHKHMRRVHEKDVEFMGDLPSGLKVILHKEVYLPVLKSHLFFQFMCKVNERLLLMISHLAMHEEHYIAGDIVFREGTVAQYMYHALIGRLDYYAVHMGMECTELSAGDWACEPALWLRWELRGRLVTVSSSELAVIDVDKFLAIIVDSQQKGEEVGAIRRFAVDVCEHFVAACPDTDLWRDTAVIRARMDESGANVDSWQQY